MAPEQTAAYTEGYNTGQADAVSGRYDAAAAFNQRYGALGMGWVDFAQGYEDGHTVGSQMHDAPPTAAAAAKAGAEAGEADAWAKTTRQPPSAYRDNKEWEIAYWEARDRTERHIGYEEGYLHGLAPDDPVLAGDTRTTDYGEGFREGEKAGQESRNMVPVDYSSFGPIEQRPWTQEDEARREQWERDREAADHQLRWWGDGEMETRPQHEAREFRENVERLEGGTYGEAHNPHGVGQKDFEVVVESS